MKEFEIVSFGPYREYVPGGKNLRMSLKFPLTDSGLLLGCFELKGAEPARHSKRFLERLGQGGCQSVIALSYGILLL